MSVIEHLGKKNLLTLAVEFSLALCLFYALFYLASSLGFHYLVLSHRAMVEQTVSGSVLSDILDIGVWGGCVFVVMAWIVYNLGSGLIRGHYRLFLTVGILVFLAGLTLWVSLVVFGLVSVFSLVGVSILLLVLCVSLAPGLFGIGRVSLFLRLFFVLLLVGLFVELASFVLFNVPVVLGLDGGVLGLHWSKVELVFSSLSNPFLPYVYLVFVLFGVGAFVFRVFPGGWLWLVSRVRCGWLVARLRDVFLFSGGGVGFLRARWVVLAVGVSSVISCLFVLFT